MFLGFIFTQQTYCQSIEEVVAYADSCTSFVVFARLVSFGTFPFRWEFTRGDVIVSTLWIPFFGII